jgi:phosphoserine phosphatase RsbU/P
MSKILIIDDEATILENLKFVLELSDYEVLSALSGNDGIKLFSEYLSDIDAVITDMKMPGLSGMDVLKEIKNLCPEMSVIILTGHGDMENAILAMKEGAYEYLMKPVNANMLTVSLKNAVSKKKLMQENKQMQNKILETNQYLQHIHDSAEKILLSLIPQSLPDIDGLKLSVVYKSCDIVGGDMYDVIDLKDKYLFYIFDVSSHGILASVITIILKSYIQNIKYNYTQLSSTDNFSSFIGELNNILNSSASKNNMFATLLIGLVDKTTNKLTYISCGHIKQYILNSDTISPLESTSTILGIFSDISFESKELFLKTGDKILLFTDGVAEITANNSIFGFDKLESLINNNKHKSIDTIVDTIITEVTDFSKGNLSDDITILGLEII